MVSAINASDRLFATAYVLDQRSEIKPRGAPEIPFGPYKTFQTTVGEIEKVTHLSFTCGQGSKRAPLSQFDPLNKTRAAIPYLAIESLGQIILTA